jgi:hypothetical protein
MHTQNDFLQHSNNAGAVWRDRLLTAGAAIIIGLSLSNTAPADETKREVKRSADVQHDEAVSQAKANYKADRAKCKELTGNDKDVCIKEAKAAEKRAKAEAKADKKTAGANAEANEETREAEFKVAKEKCESMSGSSKTACEKEAEAKYRQ